MHDVYINRDVTAFLRLLLRKEGFNFHSSSEMEIVRTIKEVRLPIVLALSFFGRFLTSFISIFVGFHFNWLMKLQSMIKPGNAAFHSSCTKF